MCRFMGSIVVMSLLISMPRVTAQQCPGDINTDGQVTVDEILTVVFAALNGCLAATPTSTPILAKPPSPTPTPSVAPTSTPGPNDCCQCGSAPFLSCGQPVGGGCGGGCSVVYNASCFDGSCIAFSPTPTTPTRTPTVTPTRTPTPGANDCCQCGSAPFLSCGHPVGGACGGDCVVVYSAYCSEGSCVSFTPTPTLTPTPNPCLGKADGTTCDAGTDGAVLTCVSRTCGPCVKQASASPRFVDNGDGTITDQQTCVVWEKKSDDGSIHDKDNTYNKSPGTAYTDFLTGLQNAGFAGHHVWRLPTYNELLSIFSCVVVGPPCVDVIFNTNCGEDSSGNLGCTVDGAGATQECSCTVPGIYMSDGAGQSLDFDGSGGIIDHPANLRYARAVRGGS